MEDVTLVAAMLNIPVKKGMLGMAGLRLVGILCTHDTAWVDSVVLKARPEAVKDKMKMAACIIIFVVINSEKIMGRIHCHWTHIIIISSSSSVNINIILYNHGDGIVFFVYLLTNFS